MARAVISLVVLGLALTAALSPTVVRLERSSRELAATFIYEGLLQRRPRWRPPGCDRQASTSGLARVGATAG